MRIKKIAMLLALMLCMSALLLPMTAFAAETGETTPTESTLANSGGASVSAIPEGAFTPEGTGTILDFATGDDGKLFYTITTEDGNIFYLIVDGKRAENNVYFLNAVTEEDLLSLAEKRDNGSVSAVPSAKTCTCTDKCETGKVNADCEVCKNDLTACIGKTVQPSEAGTGTEQSGGNNVGMIAFIVIGVLAVAGVGAYVKIIRPKQQEKDMDDDSDDDDYGEGFDPDSAYGEPEYLPDDDSDGSTGDNE